MKNIILIDGTSGIWKNDFIKCIEEKHPDSTIIEKISTRKAKDSDKKIDLNLISEELFPSDLEYVYRYNNKRYGFSHAQILNAMENHENIFIVVRNQDVIEKIQNDFLNCNVYTLFIYSNMEQIEKTLSKMNVEARNSISQAFKDYARNPEIYDMVLLNGESEEEFFRLMDVILRKVKKRNEMLSERINYGKYRHHVNIIFPLIYTVLLGIIVNVLTNGTFQSKEIISIVLSSMIIFILLIFHIHLHQFKKTEVV